MAYAAITAFLNDGRTSELSPEQIATKMAFRWSGMTAPELERELLPMFRKIQIACDFMKSHGSLDLLSAADEPAKDADLPW